MDAQARRFSKRLAAIALLLVVALAVAGSLYLSRQQAQARAAAHEELGAIADLKLAQISNWRAERMDDAIFFSRAQIVAQDLRRFLDNPSSEAVRASVLNWLNLLKGGDRYCAVMVFDARLERRLALPDSLPEPSASTRALLQGELRTPQIVLSDLHRDSPEGIVYLNLLFPVFENADPKPGAPIALVLLQLDARQFLFPVIQTWPTPSQTAETLLVRREGDDALFLNDVRHHPGSALTLRLPLRSQSLPAAKALQGDANVLEGVDYRGVPVVAAGRKIPGTPWVMVAKMDQQEIYAPLRRHLRSALLVVGSLLLASLLLVALLWRERSARSLQQAKEALARSNAELERKVQERTAQLSEANANLQTFASMAAHDLRSPLRAIKSFSTIALEDCAAQLDDLGRSHLQRISQAADQMQLLLADLLEYSKLSQAELAMEPVSLLQAVDDALALLETEIRAKNATISVGNAMPSVIGHPATLVLIIANLVSNGLKFMPEGVQPKIRIWVELDAEPTNGLARLSVEDNGIGIGPADLGKLFNVFHRLNSKQAYPGTGLGLALVRKGAERMGGRVGVESTLGKGSRFWLELRTAKA
jgi:signal transduction histidine kinase